MSKVKSGLGLILAVFVIGAGYLLLAPVPVEPKAWQPQADAGYVGVHKANQGLANLNLIDIHGETGPEHIALGPDGKLYAAVESGKIVRMQPDGSQFEVWADTKGRPLGLDFDAKGRVIVADAMLGLLAIDAQRQIVPLLTKLATDDPIAYADAVVVAKNGKIYLSDATRRFAAKQFGGTFNASILDILEHSATGRIIEFDPATNQARVVMSDLSFANGLALSSDERSLFVVETGEYRVWKIDIQTQNLSAKSSAAAPNLLLSNLPGYPDNLMRGRDGRIWLGFTKPRGAAIDNMAQKPWLRKVTLRLPKSLWPVPKAYGHVIAFQEDGKVVRDLQDPSGVYPETTSVLETQDRLYIQSLHAHAIGWLPNGANLAKVSDASAQVKDK